MPHNDSLLQAIIDNPDDNRLRLVYADWLEEHGEQERAEFIRVQCELARTPPDSLRQAALEVREKELLKQHWQEWAGLLQGWAWVSDFKRGFVEAVTVRPEDFLSHADEWFRLAPIRSIRFQTGRLQLARPHLVHLSSAPLLPRLVSSPHLARLSALAFAHNDLGDDGIATLLTSAHLAGLTSLDLTRNALGDKGATSVATSRVLSGLTCLTLSANQIGHLGVRALALSPYLTLLACLDLGGNPVGDEGVLALAGSANAGRLKTLGLARTGLGSAGARALASSPHLGRMVRLDVRDNVIGNKARQALRLRFGKGNCRFS
jgi:uncharacterized protein (TIGR02996 family)